MAQRRYSAEQIGASLYELAPGQKSFPYHWQALEEEWLIVIRALRNQFDEVAVQKTINIR